MGVALFSSPGALAIPAASSPRLVFHRRCSAVVPCASRKPAGARHPRCRRQGPDERPARVGGHSRASRVSATNVRIGHIVPALGLRARGLAECSSQDYPDKCRRACLVKKDRSSAARNRIVHPAACRGGFDSEAPGGSKAALSLRASQTALGASYRQIARRLGGDVAVFATARKLATTIYRLLRWGQPYIDQGAAAYEKQYQQRRMSSLKATAEDLGYDLIPKVAGA